MTVLVTGATGRIGSLVATRLIEEFGLTPRLLVRDPNKLDDTLAKNSQVFTGDLADPQSLVPASQNLAAALIVSPVDPQQHQLQSNLVNAIDEGFKRSNSSADEAPLIVKISGLGTALDSPVDSGRWHAQTEQHIQSTQLPFTFLRPLYFMQNLGFQLPAIEKSHKLLGAVGNAKIAMVHADDIADCAAKLLSFNIAKPNQALTLTGPEAFTYAQIATLLSELMNQDVTYQPQTLEELQRSLAAQGQPPWHQQLVLQFTQAFIEGWAERTTSCVADITGKPPRSLRGYLTEALAAGLHANAQGRNPFPS